MTDHPQLPDSSAERFRARAAWNWSKPILWGLGIGVLVGGAMVAVIFLDKFGLLPSWMIGWISDDRETQKRQFLRTLYALIAWWVATRLIKIGAFGEAAKIKYNGILSKLGFSQVKPNMEKHTRICAVRNPRIALFLVALFTLNVFQDWRALGKPFLEHSLYDLLFRIVLFSSAFFPILLNISRCVPERFIAGIVMIRIVAGWGVEFMPNSIKPVAGPVRQCNLVLSILALLISLTILVSSPSNAEPA
jgi:hypothetical protein